MLALNKWGPSGWHFIHAVMMTSPEQLDRQQREEMRSFLRALAAHLPCPKCRRHFAVFLDRELTDERLATRRSLVALMNDCHNEVNRRSGKPEYTLRQHYEWMAKGVHRAAPASDYSMLAGVTAAALVVAWLTARKIGRVHASPHSARRPLR